jgi:hypothetical protein
MKIRIMLKRNQKKHTSRCKIIADIIFVTATFCYLPFLYIDAVCAEVYKQSSIDMRHNVRENLIVRGISPVKEVTYHVLASLLDNHPGYNKR